MYQIFVAYNNNIVRSMNAIRLRIASHKRVCSAPREETEHRTVWARVVDVYDGDTFTICYVRGGKFLRRRCRCTGYDSPEIRTKDLEEKAAAQRAKEFLKNYLPSGVSRFETRGLDKYGRLLVSGVKNRETLADVMIRNGHGYAYNGGTKKKFSN